MKAKKQKSKKARTGFTIIELLIATALFLVILGIVTGAFVRGLQTQQATLKLLAANDNAHIMMEQLSREVRVGTDFSTVGESELHFRNSSGADVAYRLSGDALEKKTGGGDFTRLTASNVRVVYARFLLRGGAPMPDMRQPLLTIALGISATGKGTEGVTTNIQTTISPRLLDN